MSLFSVEDKINGLVLNVKRNVNLDENKKHSNWNIFGVIFECKKVCKWIEFVFQGYWKSDFKKIWNIILLFYRIFIKKLFCEMK